MNQAIPNSKKNHMTTLQIIWRGFKILRILARYDILQFLAKPVLGSGGWSVFLWLFCVFFRKKSTPSNTCESKKSNKGHGELKFSINGYALVEALQALGPVYVKLGQTLAVRADIVGNEVAQCLRTLQDDLPPFSGDVAVAIIEQQFGQPLTELFADFDITPVAAASIAQVHKATTKDGQSVAVKVLRPHVIDQFNTEIDFFYAIAHKLVKNTKNPEIQRLNPIQVVDTFAVWVRLETDLYMEAAAAAEFAKNTQDEHYFQVPAVHWSLTGERVLTLDWVDGVRIDDIEGLQRMGVTRDHVIRVASQQFLKQIFEHGFFHGDMHPGNMIVRPDGVLSPVDFGIMGRLDWDTRYFLADTLYGFLQQDYDLVAKAHFDYGVFGGIQDQQLFKQALVSVGEPYKNLPLKDINIAQLMARLFKITRDFNMQVQPQLLLMQKTLLVAEGVGRILNDRVNMWALSQDLIADWMKKHRGVQGRIKHQTTKALQALQAIPPTVDKIQSYVDQATKSGITLSPETIKALTIQKKQNKEVKWIFILGLVLGVLLGYGLWERDNLWYVLTHAFGG